MYVCKLQFKKKTPTKGWKRGVFMREFYRCCQPFFLYGKCQCLEYYSLIKSLVKNIIIYQSKIFWSLSEFAKTLTGWQMYSIWWSSHLLQNRSGCRISTKYFWMYKSRWSDARDPLATWLFYASSSVVPTRYQSSQGNYYPYDFSI